MSTSPLPDDPAIDPTGRLRDGTAVTIRPMEASDAEALVGFHDSLSGETVRRRFFNVHPHLTVAEVARFTTVDHVAREALVMSVDGALIAVGRLDREPGTERAEVAFVVRDDWQGRGAGTLLLERLIDWARRRGLRRLVADTLSENRRMVDVFRHSGLYAMRRGLRPRIRWVGTVCHCTPRRPSSRRR